MKNNLLRTFFEWALVTSVLMSTGFFFWYYFKSREVRKCRVQIASAEAGYQSNHAVTAVLQGECVEYAKTNADLARFLQPSPTPPATSAPVNKPRAK